MAVYAIVANFTDGYTFNAHETIEVFEDKDTAELVCVALSEKSDYELWVDEIEPLSTISSNKKLNYLARQLGKKHCLWRGA